MILTVSKMEAEKRANPGYRAFFANGFNVTRVLVLFGWEVVLERIAAVRQVRRDVSPRGARTRKYALLRAALCVGVRDLIVFGVLTDMMRGRPAVYATFSSYDEVAHHSGLERADTMEALRKLDQHFARINRARRYAPRPYKLVVLSDHGQTQGATFKQRNGYDLGQLVERSIERGTVAHIAQGDENDAAVGHAVNEATGTNAAHDEQSDELTDRHVVALASGNLGLIYLMEEKRRLTLEEIEQRHPRLIPALRDHPHIGFLLVRSSEHGPVVLGSKGTHYLNDGRVEGEDPLGRFAPNAAAHLRRTDGFDHVADIMVNSFYDHELEQGCAFEELISFHGGMGGPADAAVHPVPGGAAAARRADRRGRARPCRAVGLAAPASGAGAAPRRVAHGTGPRVTSPLRPPIPCGSATRARSMSTESPKFRATVASKRASSSSIAGRCSSRTSSCSSSSSARIRRITWIDDAP